MMKRLTTPDKSGELLRAGKVLDISGNALIQWIGAGGIASDPIRVVESKRFGPFSTDMQIIISATSDGCSYEIIDYSDDFSPVQTQRFPNGIVPGNPDNYRSLVNAIRNTIMGVKNTRLMIVGDSTAAGETAATSANSIAQGFMVHLSQMLSTGVCPSGWQTHWGGSNRANNATGTSIAFNYADNRLLDAPSGWSAFDSANCLGACVPINSSNTNPITFSPTVPTDTIDVYYIDSSGYNPFEVAVGASVLGTATIVGTGTVIRKASFSTGLPAALNTYLIRRSSAAGNFIPVGWEAYNSAIKEITFSNGSVGSTLLQSFFAKTPTQPWHSLRVLADASSEARFDAVIIDYGINHWVGEAVTPLTQTPATYYDKLVLAVSYLRAAGIPVILHCPPASPKSITPQYLQLQFIEKIYAVAKAYGLMVVDSYSYWGDFDEALARGWQGAIGNVHPSKLGYAVKAQFFYNALEYLIKN